MAENEAIGAALVIPSNLLIQIRQADALIENLAKTSEKTQERMNKAFASMAGEVNQLIKPLDSLISLMNTLGVDGGKKLSQGMEDASKNTGQAADNAKKLEQNLTNAKNQASGIAQAVSQVAGSTIAGMTSQEKMILAQQMADGREKAAAKRSSAEKKAVEDAFNHEMKLRHALLQAEVDIAKRQMQIEEQRTKKTQDEAQKRVAAYKEANAQQLKNPQDAIDFARHAGTIQRQTQALKVLKAAYDSLSPSTKNFATIQAQLKAEIDRVTASLKHDKDVRDKIQTVNRELPTIQRDYHADSERKGLAHSFVVAQGEIDKTKAKITELRQLIESIKVEGKGNGIINTDNQLLLSLMERVKSYSALMRSDGTLPKKYQADYNSLVARLEYVKEYEERMKGANMMLKTEEAALHRLTQGYKTLSKEMRESLNARTSTSASGYDSLVRSQSMRNVWDKTEMQQYYKQLEQESKAAYAREMERIRARIAARQRLNRIIESSNEHKNSTLQGSLDYAKQAQSISQLSKAIGYLTTARDKENYKTKEGQNNIRILNDAIKKHSEELERARGNAENLRRSHSNLLNISQQLGRQLALAFSVSSIKDYAKDIAQVRGEMELQQISLRSILQDRNKADDIFARTKALAVQSPFRVGDLVKYVKQLAAYRIESDRLFDTTKRLADVSAGLGIDLSRLILAYGQVKAAAYLRGCLAKGTMIKTKRGVVAVEDIVVGDTLYNENNQEVHVMELIRGREQMYDIIQEDAMTYRVNENHILTVVNAYDTDCEYQDKYVTDIIGHENKWLGVTAQFNEHNQRLFTHIHIEKVGIEDYYGFVLDGNKRFQLEDGTVTHNTEVRQFTEAGVNMYGELQSYFKEVKGEAYTTAQIVDMISKRKVTFEDVAQVFERLTNQGGIFYNMQQIQSETLYGKMEKLKDQIYLMKDAVGSDFEPLIKGSVDATAMLLKHWELVLATLKAIVGVIVVMKMQSVTLNTSFAAMFTRQAAFQVTSVGQFFTAFIANVRGAKAGLKSLGGGLSTFFANLAGAVAMHPYITLLAVLASTAYSVYNSHRKAAEAIRETSKNEMEGLSAVQKLTRGYKELAKNRYSALLADKSRGDSKNTKSGELWAKEVAEFEAIKAEVENRGFEIPVDFKEPKDYSVMDKAVAYFQDRLSASIQATAAYERALASDDHWWVNPFSESLNTNFADLDKAAGSLSSWATPVSDAMAILGANYEQLSEEAKATYKVLEKGPDGTTLDAQMNYLENFHDFFYSLPFDAKYVEPINELVGGMWNSLDDSVRKYRTAYTIAFDQASKYYDQTIAPRLTGKTRAEMEVIINDFAAREKYNDLMTYVVQEWGKKKFNLEFKVNKDDLGEQVKWVDDYLRDFFATKKYKINVSYDQLPDAPLPSFIEKGDEAKKRYEAYTEAIERYERLAKKTNVTEFQEDEHGKLGLSANLVLGLNDDQKPQIFVSDVLEKLYAARQEIMGASDALGVDLNKKERNNAAKQERDIWQERIKVLQEMQSQYEKVRQYLGEEEAIKLVKDNFADDLQKVGMPDAIIKDFVPTKEGLIKALDTAIGMLPEKMKKKKLELEREKAKLQIEIDNEKLQKELDDAKNAVDKAVNAMNLRTKLTDLGLKNFEVDKLFPGLDIARSFDDIIKRAQNEYKIPEKFRSTATRDLFNVDLSKEFQDASGKKQFEEYRKQRQDIDKQIADHQMQTVQQLVKDYKNKLTDRLQIDLWYAREKAKIDENVKDPALNGELTQNLKKDRQKKEDEQTWKDFKDSELYVKTFEDAENASVVVLSTVRNKLEELRNNLKNLPADQLKAIVKATEDIDEKLIEKTPYPSLASGIKDLTSYLANRNKLEKEFVNLQKGVESYSNQDYELGKQEEEQKKVYDAKVAQFGVDSEEAQVELKKLQTIKLQRASVQALLAMTKKQQQQTSAQLTKGQKAITKINKAIDVIKSRIELAGDVTKQFVELWDKKAAKKIGKVVDAIGEVLDASKNLVEATDRVVQNFTQTATNLVETTSTAVKGTAAATAAALKTIESASVILAIISAALQVATAIANLLNNDDEKQEDIEDLQADVEELEWAYERLKQAMDDAYDTSALETYYKQSIANLEKQAVAYRQMAAAERSKKDSDENTAKEYERQAAEIEETIKELGESLAESLGGFGSAANYKSAAQEFADAWVEAFNEGSDALDALDDKMDEYFTNLIKKQLMLRASTKFIQPILEKIDSIVDEGSLGGSNGYEVVREELKAAMELAHNNLKEFSEYAYELMDELGWTGTDSSLSALQQGIEGITENTAEALESLLNSIRFFIANQSADVNSILSLLIREQNGQASEDNPMLVQLREQTGYIRELRDMFSSAFVLNANQGGRGLKVFVANL